MLSYSIRAFFICLDFVWIMWNGFVLKMLWEWLIVPEFKLSPISFFAACAICLIISLFTSHRRPPSGDVDMSWVYEVHKNHFLIPLTLLVFGYFLKSISTLP